MRLRFWRTCRVCLRWCRISLLLLILAAAGALLWFNQIGLPSFLKESLQTNLRQRGIQVEFSRMRLRMTRGIVAENVLVGDAKNPDRPALALGEVQLLLDFGGLWQGHLQVEGLILRAGLLVVPVAGTNPPKRPLEISNIQTDLRFHENDTWSLDHFQADFQGARLTLSGDVTHATELQNWEVFHNLNPGGPMDWQTQVRQVSDILEKIHLHGTPRLNLNIVGNARNPHSFNLHLQVSAPAAQTAWFNVSNLQFNASLTAPTNRPIRQILPGIWSNAAPWRLAWTARCTELNSEPINAATVTASGLWQAPELTFDLQLQAAAQTNQSKRFAAQNLEFTGQLTARKDYPTNLVLPDLWSNAPPWRLAWATRCTGLTSGTMKVEDITASSLWQAPELTFDLRLQSAALTNQSQWFAAQNLQFTGQLTAREDLPTNLALPGVWSNAAPWRLAWSTHGTELKSEGFNADSLAAGGFWQAPLLSATNLSARLGRGWSEGGLQYDAVSRRLTFTNSSVFDLHALAPFLPEISRQRLGWFTWTQPPALQFGGTVDLTDWPPAAGTPTSRPPAAFLNGGFAFTNATMSGVVLDRVGSHFTYSNQVWQLPDLVVERGQSRLRVGAAEDETTKWFQLQIQGAFDVNQIRPWLKSKTAVREVGRLVFIQPLELDVKLRGRLNDPDALAASGRLALTNFAVRGGPVDSLTTGLSYTNRILQFHAPCARRVGGAQILTADEIILDLNTYHLYFTNGFSTGDPQMVADSIGPKTGRTLEPYQFLEPPTARVNGYVALHSSENAQEMEEADLQVEVIKGAPFRWLNFNTRNITGTVHWLGGTLLLTNLNAEFYGGNATGTALFDFRPQNGTDYRFAFEVTNASLHALLADLDSPTNHLAGTLGGRLVVTRGNSTDWRLMDGYGHASLRDGLIWEAPVFELFSPVLNTIDPGLGNSRATDATGRFVMTNGVIFSDTLEIHSTMVRLRYNGTVDLWEKLNARVEAQPLRDTWGFGPLLNTVFHPLSWFFEYKVTGTLADPKSTPMNDLAKLLLAPLHPVKTLENILPAGNTNSAPARK